jgi:enoyl-CoA hydratase/carnithine racemase
MTGEVRTMESCGTVESVANGRILEVSLANPPDNRLTPPMVAGLAAAMDRFEGDDFDVLVITGAKRAFSKGFDVDAIKAYGAARELRSVLVQSNAVFTRIAQSAKPTVAAINGACMGGGLELALACHFRVCAEKARLGLPEVWLNLVPGLGGFYRLARLIGSAKALELVALGDLITADEALRLNIVNRVFPADGYAERVAAFVNALGGQNRQAMREIIRLAACSENGGEEENVRQATDSFVELWACLPKA